jgi:hypothetical protein
MRDGVLLRADVLLPSADGKFPALIYRTPYGKHLALREYKTFEKAVAHGYAVVVQDVRGRYASDGEFVAYQNEGRDGYDTIEWGREATVVRRQRRHLRALLSWRGAMARRGGKSSAPESHGSGPITARALICPSFPVEATRLSPSRNRVDAGDTHQGEGRFTRTL